MNIFEMYNNTGNDTKDFSSNNNATEILGRIYQGGNLFSIISLASNIAILLIIGFGKILGSLTYNFLLCIFLSEIIRNIGNICEYAQEKKRISFLLIPFSDISTMTLFCFFSYCSNELIIKSNRNIKEKEKLFFLISFLISGLYSLIIFFILINHEDYDNNEYYNNKEYRFYNFFDKDSINSIRFINIAIIIAETSFLFYRTYKVLEFMNEKQKTDKINSWKIAKLKKILFRFPIICFLYWIFYLPSAFLSISDTTKERKITYIFKLFSVSFFNLRGFLIFLNTIQTSKVQTLLQRFFEVYIKHKLILRLDFFSKRKGNNKKKDKEEDKFDDNVDE